MNSSNIRRKFISYFKERGHAIIPSAPLVPENDPSVLFNTAGMQPLVPYLVKEKHPQGQRIVNVQKCVRTQDIDEVGDNIHDTFFEMLGNWSLGDPESSDGIGENGYFKKEAIFWSYEFLTSKDEGLGLDPARLYFTVFEGNDDAPRDEESFSIWQSVGVPANRIYFMGAKDNWWSAGDNGPCGPDTEMFYDLTKNGLGDLSKEEFIDATSHQQIVEVWNDVFMEYNKVDGVVVGKLAKKNVDTGAGLERLSMIMQRVNNIFDTDLFADLIKIIQGNSSTYDLRSARIVADHIRTSVFMIADGVSPSNTDRGYVLRRLLRRAIRFSDKLGLSENTLSALTDSVISKYSQIYPNLKDNKQKINSEIFTEESKFRKTLSNGLKEFEKISKDKMISGADAFLLFSTYGFPFEVTSELAKEKGVEIDQNSFADEMKKHQDLSRTGSEQKFKGGLADTSEQTTMLHTCTHLMLAGLRKYLGTDIHQAGSNITTERTRFDFTYPQKVSPDVLRQVEEYVNEAISKKANVVIEQMQKDEAKSMGVEGSFWDKYPDVVNVYMVKAPDGTIYSQELCGGPHVKNTGDIEGTFKIIKEEASSAGIRRIKAVLE